MDFLLSDIFQTGRLSAQTKMLCADYQLNNLEEVFNFILSNDTLIENLGLESDINNDLLVLFLDYVKYTENSNLLLKIPIHLLAINENMSQRTYHICMNAGFDNLNSLLTFRNNNPTFKKYRNCGQLSNDELEDICKKYNNLDIIYSNEDKSNEFKIDEVISNSPLDDISLDVLANIELMSVRSYNACIKADLTSLKLIMQFYYKHPMTQFLQIRNCGVKANDELVSICKKYERMLISSESSDSVEINYQTKISNFLGKIKLDFDYEYISQNIKQFSFIPLFKVLDLLILANNIFDKVKQVEIFRKCFNCYLPIVDYTLDEVGNSLDITRERVRQIRSFINRKMLYGFKFLDSVESTTFFDQYSIGSGQPFIFIDNERAAQINLNEQTNFTPNFIAFILSHLLRESHIRFGDLTIIFSNRIFRKDCFDKHFYLINRVIAEEYNFKKLHIYLKSIISEKHVEDVRISYDSLLKKFAKKDTLNYPNSIIDLINLIVNKDFGEVIDIDDNGLVIYKNAKKTFLYYIIDILQESYKPLHYTEIYHQMLKMGLNVSSAQSIHSLLNRENDIFGLKGAGVFDLRSKGGYFGSIGDVAEQLLKETGQPIHIKDLENFICNQLNVSKDSIRVVLFSYENEDRFIMSRDSFVKLKRWQRT